MRRPILCFILSGLLFGACVDVQAIAVDDYSVAETNPAVAGYSLDWDYIYKYQTASSVAVDHYWILTAAHVADDGPSGNLIVDGETYTQQEIVFHDTADLALVRYDKPFPGYYLLHEGEIHDEKPISRREYYELIMAGYGYDGTVAATSFTEGGVKGIKRWGTNRGEGEAPINMDVGGTVGSVSTSCFLVDFDLVDTDYEAGGNTYDSGGSVFIDDGSGWKLTGINLYRSGTGPFTGNAAAMIHDYIPWIKSVIVDYDTDMDGLPDWWETLYGTGSTSMDASADLDSDDFTNYEEWLADTLPNDSNSFLRVTEYTNATSLVFSSSINRKYQIQYRVDLTDTNEVWETEVDWFDGSLSQTMQPVSTPTSNRFYRVRATLR